MQKRLFNRACRRWLAQLGMVHAHGDTLWSMIRGP